MEASYDLTNPPEFVGHLYAVNELLDVSDILGYELNAEAIEYGLSQFRLNFHTDEWVERLSHDLCERVDNYGVISGNMGGIWLQCAVPDWGKFRVGPIIIDFSTFSLSKVKVGFHDNPSDEFKLKGEFVLGEGNDGIDPIVEDVTVNVGTSSLVIPAPYSFVEKKAGVFEYKGIINSTDVEIKIKTKDYVTYNLKVKVQGTDLTNTSNPVGVGLIIGNDKGNTNIRLEGVLKSKENESND